MSRKGQFEKGHSPKNRRELVYGDDQYESLQRMADKFNASPALIHYYLRT